MENVEIVVERIKEAQRALNVGGWHRPINAATHVIDVNDYEFRLRQLAFDPENQERFTRATWIQRDICDREPWPFPDKYFEFATCSHVLEDVRDPVWVLSELSRVAEAGYIECPNPAFELLTFAGFLPYVTWPKGPVGNAHHRWLVEIRGDEPLILFRLKPHDLIQRGRYIKCTRLHVVRWERSVSYVFWEGKIEGREVIFDIGEWIDSLIPEAKSLVSFNPLARLRDKIRRLTRPNDGLPEQPPHGPHCKYPYF